MNDSDLTANFPEYEEEILLLLKQDNNFTEVAEDYIFCRKELTRFSSRANPKLFQQYTETLEDLKEEIISRLKQVQI